MSATDPVTVKIDNGLAFVTIDNPPVNATSQAVRAGLMRAAEAVAQTPGLTGVVLQCAGKTFVAGAEISELGKPPKEPHLPDVIAAIARSPVPWVAALKGVALGGGLEIALGCHGRVAAGGTRLGLPEVHLGIIPGAGGTVRLPRLVPLAEAVEMITSGKPIDAEKALEIGLIDRIAEGSLKDSAAALVRDMAGAETPLPLAERAPRLEDGFDWAAAEKRLAAKSRGQASPVEALRALRESVSLASDEALRAERARFLRLAASPEASALRHVFFAERRAGARLKAVTAAPVALEQVGVIGGGTMGAGISAALLLAGSSVTLVERDRDACDVARARVAAILSASLRRGLLDQSGHDAALGRLACHSDYASLRDCTLVIEAVFEDMAVKAEVFDHLDSVMPPHAILATNTSYLDVGALARRSAHPDRVIGLHFFSPAHIMKLLEVVRTEDVGDTALATAGALARHLRKTAVVAGVCDGFIGNRIMAAYRRECDFMLEEGALPQQIDAAMRDYGFAMGIYAVQDMSGLDVAWAMRKRRAETRPPDERYSRLADLLCEAGRFGRKTGAGWYRYEEDKPVPDPEVEKIILAESRHLGLRRTRFDAERIMERILGVMQDEADKVLTEGIADCPGDIDVTLILGYGFPRHKGGPMFQKGLPRA